MKYFLKVMILLGVGFFLAYLFFDNGEDTVPEGGGSEVTQGDPAEASEVQSANPKKPKPRPQKQDFLGTAAHEAIPELETPSGPQSYPSEFRQIAGELEDQDNFKREMVAVAWDSSCDGIVDQGERFPELSERARELGFEGQSVIANDVPIQNWNQYFQKNGFYYQVSVFRVAADAGARFSIHLFQSADPEFAEGMRDISQAYPGLNQSFGRAGVWRKVEQILEGSETKGARTVSYRMGQGSTAMYWNGQISYLARESVRCQTSAGQGKAVCRCL